jgi:hypothetical protein
LNRLWFIGVGIVLIVGSAFTLLWNATVGMPNSFCYGGGVSYVTTTLSNGSKVTYSVISSPVCGLLPLNIVTTLIVIIIIGVTLIYFGVTRKRAVSKN